MKSRTFSSEPDVTVLIFNMEDEEEYDNLKGHLDRLITPIDVHAVKSHFSAEINSKRELQEITIASDLFQSLENRDLLSSDNVACLVKIGTLLRKNEINKLLHTYQKLQDCNDGLCSCGQNVNIVPPPVILLNHNAMINKLDSISEEKRKEQLDLDAAIANVSEHIGELWAILARELQLTEKDISEIRKITKDSKLQAFNALLLWKRKADSQVTVAMLEMALNARLCLRRGLGSHLLSMKKIQI